MKLKLFLVASLVLLIGCDVIEQKTERKTEEVFISQVVYSPGIHSSRLSPGITLGGDITLNVTNVNVPEKWNTVFTCQHGGFVVDSKAIYNFAAKHVGKTVTCVYDEIYMIEIDHDTDKIKSCTLNDRNFVGLKLEDGSNVLQEGEKW